MTEKHSPLLLPLTSVENSWQYTTIYEANGKELFRFDLEDWGVTELNQDRLEKRMAEVVSLIVRAVNGLPEAIAALELQEAADEAHVNCPECDGEEAPEMCPHCFPLFDDARIARRAALSKVKG